MSNKILLKGRGIRKEALANAAITPGYLVERMSTDKVRKHATAAGPAQASYAVEDELNGTGIDTDIDAADNCVYETLPPGAEVNALVAAAAVAIVIGDALESAGDGTLRKATVGDEADLTDNSGGTASDTLAVTTGSYVQATEANQVASMAAKINSLLPGAGHNIVAYALEAVDNSGGGAEARLKVEVV